MLQRIDKPIISYDYPFKIDVMQEDISLDFLVMMSQFSSLHISLMSVKWLSEEENQEFSVVTEEPIR